MDDIQEVIQRLRSVEEVQQVMLNDMREVVRSCSRTISRLHRGEPLSDDRLNEIMERLNTLRMNAEKYPTFLNYLIHAEQEYVELMIVRSVLNRLDIPGSKELGVDLRSYLLGMMDAISELRRDLLDMIRNGDLNTAEYIFSKMTEMYEWSQPIVFTDSVLHGFRGKQDVARRAVEQARSELTLARLLNTRER